MIENYDNVDVFVGVDVGKSEHRAVAINGAGKVIFDKALPNDEAKMQAVLQRLKQHGTVLVVVDQPATIGALPIAVAQAEEVLVGYLPGLAMRRIADLYAGEAKTNARDAAIIAQAARTLPHALRSIQLADESVAELSMLCARNAVSAQAHIRRESMMLKTTDIETDLIRFRDLCPRGCARVWYPLRCGFPNRPSARRSRSA